MSSTASASVSATATLSDDAAYSADSGDTTRNAPRASSSTSSATSSSSSTVGNADNVPLEAILKEEDDTPEKKKKKEEEEKKKKPRVGFFQLYRFATALDIVVLIWATLMAVGTGAIQPITAIIFGNVVNGFTDPTKMVDSISQSAIWLGVLGAGAMFSGFCETWGFAWTARRQSNRIRRQYFRAVMRQEMGWFDGNESGSITTRGSGDVVLVQEAMGDKVGLVLQYFSMFITGLVIAFCYSWKMSLVCLSVVPLLALCGTLFAKLLGDMANQSQDAYAKAGAVAEEVISSIRTVAAFGGQERENARFGEQLVAALKAGMRKAHIAGLTFGMVFLLMFGSYGLAFWYGATLIRDGELTPGSVVTTFFSILIGSMAVGQGAPPMTAIATGQGAAHEIFAMLDRESEIDVTKSEGKRLKKYKGNITFRKVNFEYPTRREQTILDDLSIDIEAGSTVAIVGPSGSGKSTIVQLIERFYDPLKGTVMLDGVDLKDLSLPWWREQIGIVSQEPVLFATSIRENIRYGRLDATEEEIIAAAKEANAHHFIQKLPNGYDTGVGERGGQLSGGQKQRIAIARALVRNPKILLLDEATSALDNKAERVVQNALDKARQGRTTVVIAHRLSTIRDADKIIVLKDGQVAEQGTHESLYGEGGIYTAMVDLQRLRGEQNEMKSIKGSRSCSASSSKRGSSSKRSSSKRSSSKRSSSTRRASSSASSAASRGSSSDNDDDSSSISGVDDDVETVMTAEQIEAEKQRVAKEREKEETVSSPILRAIRLNSPEWPFLVVGMLGAAAGGVVFPAYALIFSDLMQDIILKRGQPLMDAAAKWAAVFTGLGGGTLLTNYLQTAMFMISGERLTDRIRRLLFAGILRQEVAWFDDPLHATGALSTKLSTSAALIQGVTGQRLGQLAQIVATLVAGAVIALIACWQLALVVIACIPIVMFGGVMEMQAMMGSGHKSKLAYERAGAIQTESVMAIRTVVGLCREQTFIELYEEALDPPHKKELLGAFLRGIGYGFGQASTMGIFGLTFWYGSTLVANGTVGIGDMFKAIMAIMFAGMGTGQVVSMMADFDKAKKAAAEIFALQDRVPSINSTDGVGKPVEKTKGALGLEDVVFRYAQRPNQTILKEVSLDIRPGQTIALVGASGCGKSTVMQLVERFYDPLEGTVEMDGRDMAQLNVQDVRKLMGLVQQEPVLFSTTIRDNILYGKPEASEEEMLEASRKANLHEFVMALRDKYDTQVGSKGSKLSGGQKQRVAIARALIRDPKILLLDEATSALDTKAERIVQDALDKARKGRTTLMIAHRLSTIQDADVIVAMDNGKIMETGTHEELMAKKGTYYRMVISRAET